MRDWKPPFKPDPLYAHIFRFLLGRSYKKWKKKMTTEQSPNSNTEEFHWRYAILEKKHGGETYYHVCEEYPGMGYTGAETPMGDTPEELQEVLEMMLDDVKGAIAHKNIIVDGAPYDNWRTKELEKGECLSVEETEEWLKELEQDE